MITCLTLEQPGKWRAAGLLSGFLLALSPALALVASMDGSPLAGMAALLTGPFGAGIGRSLAVAVLVAALSVVIGWPTGIVAGLYDFPARRLWLGLLALPLLVPSFILAIGLSLARSALGFAPDGALAGLSGTVIAFTMFGAPLVVFITMASARGISRSQVDAARSAGGERHVCACVARAVLPAATLTAALAGVLTLSDPGPGQILGFSGAASELLVSFAAQYDFALAARQCLLLAGVVFALALPVSLLFAPQLASGLLARDVTPAPLMRTKTVSLLGPLWLGALVAFTLAAPLAGFVRPLFRSFPLQRVAQEIGRTVIPTLTYGLLAGLVATVLGVALAVCAGRNARLRVGALAGLMLVMALPPALGALGWIHLAGVSPAALDPVLRSSFTVGLALAFRWFPVVILFAIRGLGTTSPSWAGAAAIHGVRPALFARKVLAGWLAPVVVPAALLVVLLATADVGSVLLLHPPGRSSLPLAIFTVMANAPESLVGAMCLSYVGIAVAILAIGLYAARDRRPAS